MRARDLEPGMTVLVNPRKYWRDHPQDNRKAIIIEVGIQHPQQPRGPLRFARVQFPGRIAREVIDLRTIRQPWTTP